MIRALTAPGRDVKLHYAQQEHVERVNRDLMLGLAEHAAFICISLDEMSVHKLTFNGRIQLGVDV